MKEITAVGRTIEEAVDSGLKQIQLLKEEVEITIVDEGNKGFLGLFGKRQAVVKLVEKRDALKLATQYLDKIVKSIDPKANIVSKKETKKISFHIDGDKTSLMIGKRGQTLYSLETLVQLVFNRYSDQYHHITIDIGDYRKKRQEALEQYAIKTANRVLKTKRKKKKGKHRWCLSCGIVSLSSCVCSFFLPPPPPTLPPPGVNRAVFSPGRARSPGEQVGRLPAPPLLSHFVGDVSFAPLGLLTLLTCQPLGRASDRSIGQPRQSRAQAPLAHSLRGTEGIWGWCPPCVTNPAPLSAWHPLCVPLSSVAWGQAKVVEQWPSPWPAPAHTHPMPRGPEAVQETSLAPGCSACIRHLLGVFLYTASLGSLATACKVCCAKSLQWCLSLL